MAGRRPSYEWERPRHTTCSIEARNSRPSVASSNEPAYNAKAMRVSSPALALGCALGLAAAGSAGCRPRSGPHTLGSSPQAHVEDTDRLPTFEAEPLVPEGPERFYVPVGDAPVRGAAEASITLVMYTDFECPFCARGYETVERLLAHYGQDLRVVYKAFPLDMHPHALVAAMAARSAHAQGRFWAFHDRLHESKEELTPEALLRHAQASGLDMRALLRDIDTLEYASAVRRDLREGRRLGISSTPTFFVNGRMIAGAKPYEDFVALIDDELQRTKAWRDEGVAAAELYEHAIADGWRRVEYTEEGAHLDPDRVYVVPLGDSPTIGLATAPITLVAFEDLECLFCIRGHETLRELQKIYGDKIRLVLKHNPLPFHSHAFLAARATLAADRQGKFWPYYEALHEHGAKLSEKILFETATKVGLDLDAFSKAMSSARDDHRIEADVELAMNLGVNGTPAYFINGRPLEGAVPLLTFRLIVEEELERAQQLLREGVAPEALYHELTHRPLD